ncbi:LLM class flavin-dependent oxidoreductase [Mycobacterium sp. CVI_P3]|uniref:LLM class flavin-dependent oxidoreductase n=1 Tax=Mycobacterium pinniadriaticum TaxID=2994102 RepID=A0ABT3SBH7_9MYCO|nr:LLM class flavin-dependent oxidoreductase [Mycobacterium pinniadriaticum]MCX2929873.1 LLM class flavin-dependent oxidoreductase [Mycobacterium pinniadriaticum]MCX2936478.1 LLM class flavin-dependent oxidoreductase [Mycobacterium pinniadriaticum]
MKYGMLWEMQLGPRPWPANAEANHYWDAIEQAKLAEQVGFDYLWHVEHHFLTEYSHASSPEVWLSAVAQHTERIRIGHGVVLLPPKFNPSFHVAERIAALDVMSNGRVEFGTGRAATASELEAYGIDPADARGMWQEALQEIPKMWRDEPYPGFDGTYMKLPSREVWPKPIQRPGPPMWMAASSPESFEIAGRNGLGVLAFIIGHADNLTPLIEVYRDAIKQCPKPPEEINNQIAAYVLTHVADSREEARAVGGPAVEWYTENVFKLFSTVSGKPGYEIYAKMLPENAADIERLVEKYGNAIDPLIELGVISVGTPEECRKTIESFSSIDVDQIITSHAIGGISHEKVMRSIELFGNEVIPHVRASSAVSA